MMKGYDKEEALAYITNKINKRDYAALANDLTNLISDMIDLDMQYMHDNNVLDPEGNAGTAYYDDDEAFEFILDNIATKHKMGADTAMQAASLLDDYFDHQQSYLELKGLVDWD